MQKYKRQKLRGENNKSFKRERNRKKYVPTQKRKNTGEENVERTA
jgi:hypothetical protein